MEKKKHAGGRPRYYTTEVLNNLAISLTDWVDDHAKHRKFGMLRDWCFEHKFNPKYFKLYADQNDTFKEAYEYAKTWQEHIVCRQALTGQLNARFAQFFLCCSHKWRVNDPEDSRFALLGNDYGRFLDHLDSLKKIKDVNEEEEED